MGQVGLRPLNKRFCWALRIFGASCNVFFSVVWKDKGDTQGLISKILMNFRQERFMLHAELAFS